jgi:hypothetical protein
MAVFSQLALAVLADSDDEGCTWGLNHFSVMVLSSLIFMTRSIWVKSLLMRRKLPGVIRVTAAMAWASVKS